MLTWGRQSPPKLAWGTASGTVRMALVGTAGIVHVGVPNSVSAWQQSRVVPSTLSCHDQPASGLMHRMRRSAVPIASPSQTSTSHWMTNTSYPWQQMATCASGSPRMASW